jgi:hypothetical protein
MNSVMRGSVAIVGAAESDIGAVAALMSPIDLMAQGINRALHDAGLTLKNVDGGVLCHDAGADIRDVAGRVPRTAQRLY